MRSGFSRCNGANLPVGSHHSAAMREKRSISAGSTVVCPGALAGSVIAALDPYGAPGVYTPLSSRSMARIVLKFGGTSVGDTDRIKNVARKVKAEVGRGNEVAVVVSAMSGATNQLVKWVNDIAPMHDPQEYDVVVATGEQVTIGLLAMALQQLDVKARSWSSWQIPIRTDAVHARARIQAIETAEMAKSMAAGEVPIVPGFQGVSPEGRITTLGRGGSDTSAVALRS